MSVIFTKEQMEQFIKSAELLKKNEEDLKLIQKRKDKLLKSLETTELIDRNSEFVKLSKKDSKETAEFKRKSQVRE